ncbi:MAG: FAD-binding protein [Planctomycetota bacterium]|nr:FAD-binding protein [Planctomycetota bacterium]
MKHSPESLAKLLKGEVRGEVFCDPVERSLYATDASIYEIEPMCVVWPKDEEDVSRVLRIAGAEGIPVGGRGAGSGLAGESLSHGIVLDFTVHMNAVLNVDEGERTTRVQPGIALDVLNDHLKPLRLKFGPDPASGNRATIGGMIANNSTGAHSIVYGATRDNLGALTVCLADGSRAVFRPVRLDGEEYRAMRDEPGRAGAIHRELPPLLEGHAGAIEKSRPRTTRNRAGYLLYDVLKDGIYDPARLLCPSEGTLALFVEATLKLVPLPAHTALALAYFPDLLAAAGAVPAILETGPTAVECQDSVLLKLGRAASPASAHLFPPEYGAMLVVEFAGGERGEVEAKLAAFDAAVEAGRIGASRVVRVTGAREQREVWAARKASEPLLFRRRDELQPVPVVEDAAVPPDRLAEYLRHVVSVFDRYGLAYSAYAHAGHGELHIRPMMNLRRRDHVELLERLCAEIYPKAIELGGTISGEHGGGLLRTQWLKLQYGPEILELFRAVKRLFDPRGILNPDRIVTDDDRLMTKNLRFGAGYRFDEAWRRGVRTAGRHRAAVAPGAYAGAAGGGTALHWAPGEFARAVEKCNGCAHCRSLASDARMCPRFRRARIEDAASRAKANIARRLMAGRLPEGAWDDRRLWEVLEWCFHCQQCFRDCPSGVEISRIVFELRARRAQERGLFWRDRVACDSEFWTALGSLASPLYNFAVSSKAIRRLMEALFGIDRRRPVPRVAKVRPSRRFDPSAGDRPVAVYFPDLFARYNAPEIAQAAVDALERNGYAVEIPPVRWTGFPLLESGDLPRLRRLIARNAAILAPYARRGVPIICTEATATLCMTREHLWVLDTPDTRAVARNTFDICEFLDNLRRQGRLNTGFRPLPLTVAYQAACHYRAMERSGASARLMALVPELKLIELNEGCCGMAGTFGLFREGYAESMEIGARLFERLRKDDIAVAATESSACRMQLEHGSGKPVVHPIQILARAWGGTGVWERSP